MKIYEIIIESKSVSAAKPRNFVAKNAKMGGAGQHKDKKKAEKQGDVKHKKDLATMEGIRDLGYDAQSLIFKLRRDVEEKRLQATPQAVLAAARELAGDMNFAPQLLVQQVLGKKVTETATAGSTSAANVAVGAVYKNKKPKMQKPGTNALDMKGGNLMTGGSIAKR